LTDVLRGGVKLVAKANSSSVRAHAVSLCQTSHSRHQYGGRTHLRSGRSAFVTVAFFITFASIGIVYLCFSCFADWIDSLRAQSAAILGNLWVEEQLKRLKMGLSIHQLNTWLGALSIFHKAI
jgi:hypothetical protein